MATCLFPWWYGRLLRISGSLWIIRIWIVGIRWRVLVALLRRRVRIIIAVEVIRHDRHGLVSGLCVSGVRSMCGRRCINSRTVCRIHGRHGWRWSAGRRLRIRRRGPRQICLNLLHQVVLLRLAGKHKIVYFRLEFQQNLCQIVVKLGNKFNESYKIIRINLISKTTLFPSSKWLWSSLKLSLAVAKFLSISSLILLVSFCIFSLVNSELAFSMYPNIFSCS